MYPVRVKLLQPLKFKHDDTDNIKTPSNNYLPEEYDYNKLDV